VRDWAVVLAMVAYYAPALLPFLLLGLVRKDTNK